jgi:hypothetical protein
MEQNLPYEINGHSTNQNLFPPFMKPQVSILCSLQRPTGPYPVPDEFRSHLLLNTHHINTAYERRRGLFIPDFALFTPT